MNPDTRIIDGKEVTVRPRTEIKHDDDVLSIKMIYYRKEVMDKVVDYIIKMSGER